MAYDSALGKIVLFGGAGSSWPPNNDTWLFDGTRWTRGPTGPAIPAGRTGARMVYDPAIRKVVMFGGSGMSAYSDTWLFDGTQWVQGPVAPPGLSPRVFFGMTYDPTLGKVVVAGGDGGSDVWLFDGTSWAPGPPMPAGTSGRERVQLAYDPQLGGDVMFGGLGPAPADSNANVLEAGAWSTVSMNQKPRPPARLDPQLVWDSTKQSFMVFGGVVGSGSMGFSDTWILTAPALAISPTSGPSGTAVGVSSGPGWPAGGTVKLMFGQTLLSEAAADESGNVDSEVTIPPGTKGPVALKVASGAVGVTVTATFTVTTSMRAATAPASRRAGPAGAQAREGGSSPAAPPAYAQTPVPANGKITAHGGQFWLGSKAVLLRGMDASPIQKVNLADADYANIQSWNMNVVRFRVHWGDMETKPPVNNGDGTWTHKYNLVNLAALQSEIAMAYEHGEYVLIENYCGPPCFGNGWPSWLYQAPYNSHGLTYTDATTAATNYWTDPLQQQFTSSYFSWLAGQLAGVPGVLGYEALNEPSQGTYPDSQSTTAMILGVELTLCKAVRASDPGRVIFFSTRGSSGAGIVNADLSGFAAMGNVAFDLHDYFGGRWGPGLNLNPASPTYGESLSIDFDFALTGNVPYLGTTYGQERFMQTYLDVLGPLGIPLFIGELGGQGEAEPNIVALFATMTGGANALGVSWAAQTYNGKTPVLKPDGSPEPWLATLIQAASA